MDHRTESTISKEDADGANDSGLRETSSYDEIDNIEVQGLAVPKFTLCAREYGDFADLVTIASNIYQSDRGRYFDGRCVNQADWENLSIQSKFQLSQAEVRLEPARTSHVQKRERLVSRVVIQRFREDGAKIHNYSHVIRQLRVLNHLYGNENIVKLLGIGWFCDADPARCFAEPVLIMEQVESTLAHAALQQRILGPEAMLGLFHGIAKGLSTLHACGIIHGNLCEENVLIVPTYSHNESKMYVPKLSNFGMQHDVTSNSSVRLAPEIRHRSTPWLRITYATDVWSLGVLYAIVSTGDEDDAQSEILKLELGLRTQAQLEYRLIEKSPFDPAESTSTPTMLQCLQALFHTSIRVDPVHRNIDMLLRRCDAYRQLRHPLETRDQIQKVRRRSKLQARNPSDLVISYSAFQDSSGIIKDQLVRSLEEIIQISDPPDPRCDKALFQLAVISLSNYARPAANFSQGLRYLQRAAEYGNLQARVLLGRVTRAYCKDTSSVCETSQSLQWLYQAAVQGSQIAWDDLKQTHPDLAAEALTKYAAGRCKGFMLKHFSVDLPEQQQTFSSTLSTDISPLLPLAVQTHQAAAMGDKEKLTILLRQNPVLVNSRDRLSRTPLLQACRFGRIEAAAALLLDFSADASLSNQAGENPLHFLWRFSETQCESLLRVFVSHGAQLDATACYDPDANAWGLLPNIAATPIERASFVGRIDLMKMLILHGCLNTSETKQTLWRLLLMSVRLRRVSVQRFLLEYIADTQAHGGGEDLHGIFDLRWKHRGTKKSLLDAAVLGWVHQTGVGEDVSIDFWHACHHYSDPDDALRSTFETVLALYSDRRSEKLLDDAILLAIDEKSYKSVEQLLVLKIRRTDGTLGRVTTLRPMCWTETRAAIVRAQEREFSGASADERPLVARPMLRIAYIDQIYHKSGTLAQQMLRDGDRVLFHLLLERYGANMTLPVRSAGTPDQINCYAALAMAGHQDMYFVDKLLKHGVRPCAPYDTYCEPGRLWAHPLFHAIKSGASPLYSKILEQGASLIDPMGTDQTVFSELANLRPIPNHVIDVLSSFGGLRQDISQWIPSDLEATHGGYNIFLSIFNALTPPYSLLIRGTQHSVQTLLPPDRLGWIFRDLLKHYPAMECRPHPRSPSVLSMMLNLFSTGFFGETPCLSFHLQIVPAVRVSVTFDGTREEHRARPKISVRVASPAASSQTVNDAESTIPSIQTESSRQPIIDALCSIIYGSPLDVLTIDEYLNSKLWQHRLFMSFNILRLLMEVEGLTCILLVVSFLGLPVAITLITLYGQIRQRIALMCFRAVVLMVAVGAGYLALQITHLVMALLYRFITLVCGPGTVPVEYFEIPQVENPFRLRWAWRVLQWAQYHTQLICERAEAFFEELK